jgi:putative hydrolase of the HAD superfamily
MLIAVDLDDTLLDHSSAARQGANRLFQHHRNAFPMDEPEFSRLWHAGLEDAYRLFLSRRMGLAKARRLRMKNLFATVGIRLGDRQADELGEESYGHYKAGWALFSDVVPCLKMLRGEYRLAVITNGSQTQQIDKLDCTNIRSYFDAVLVSETAGAAKPASAIFMEAGRCVGTDAGHSIHVGDQWQIDVEGSRNAGMMPIWLNRSGKPPPADAAGDVPAIVSLSECARTVDAMERVK